MTTINFEIIDDEPPSIAHSTEILNSLILELSTVFERNGIEIQNTIRSFPLPEDFSVDLEKRSPDILIVDLAFESAYDRRGWEIIHQVAHREIIPVIVYSAHADDPIPDDEIYKNLLIIRQKKGEEDTESYKNILRHMIVLKLKFIIEKDRINKEFGKVSLETCKKLIDEREIQNLDENILSSLVLSRLISLLLNTPPQDNEKFPPESIFIYPPLEFRGVSKNSVMLGDILNCKQNDEMKGFWIVCSPSCDLVFDDTNQRKNKVKDVLLLPCYTHYTKIRSLYGKDPNIIKSSIRNSLSNKASKLLKCPTNIFGSNFLLVYFKEYRTLDYCKIKANLKHNEWEKIASLATPYAESLQNLFLHDFSRIGTPDTALESEEREWIADFLI